jgi:hypothetical protein
MSGIKKNKYSTMNFLAVPHWHYCVISARWEAVHSARFTLRDEYPRFGERVVAADRNMCHWKERYGFPNSAPLILLCSLCSRKVEESTYRSMEHHWFPGSTPLTLAVDLAPFSSYTSTARWFPSVRHDEKCRFRHYVPSRGHKTVIHFIEAHLM